VDRHKQDVDTSALKPKESVCPLLDKTYSFEPTEEALQKPRCAVVWVKEVSVLYGLGEPVSLIVGGYLIIIAFLVVWPMLSRNEKDREFALKVLRLLLLFWRRTSAPRTRGSRSRTTSPPTDIGS